MSKEKDLPLYVGNLFNIDGLIKSYKLKCNENESDEELIEKITLSLKGNGHINCLNHMERETLYAMIAVKLRKK